MPTYSNLDAVIATDYLTRSKDPPPSLEAVGAMIYNRPVARSAH
jgi:hypothetical protein